MDGIGGKPGWAWIFLLVCFTVRCKLLQLWFLNHPHIGRIVGRFLGFYSFLRCAFDTTRFQVFNRIPERVSLSNSYFVSLYILTSTVFSIIMSRLERDRPSIKPVDRFSFKEIIRCASSPHVIIFAIISFIHVTIIYGLGLFLPSIIHQLGFSRNATQLLSAGPFAAVFTSEYRSKRDNSPDLIIMHCSSSDYPYCILVWSL